MFRKSVCSPFKGNQSSRKIEEKNTIEKFPIRSIFSGDTECLPIRGRLADFVSVKGLYLIASRFEGGWQMCLQKSWKIEASDNRVGWRRKDKNGGRSP